MPFKTVWDPPVVGYPAFPKPTFPLVPAQNVGVGEIVEVIVGVGVRAGQQAGSRTQTFPQTLWSRTSSSQTEPEVNEVRLRILSSLAVL